MLDPEIVVNLAPELGDCVWTSHKLSRFLTMSGCPTFICVLEANFALRCIQPHHARRCGILSQGGPRIAQRFEQGRLELGLRLSG